ncbi:DUF4132 domain-containing protein [Leptospira tipperaryensis]|uniref:DUF4132 domain-containing protein n=1 Tax=Leptospira tipperaryensis TaxID=2564040 RepID=UPI000AE23937|nr:DUF4132 domain-containing protein [Leptospira tipperaryensis]
MTRNFIFQKGKSEKFWSIDSNTKSITYRQGQRYGEAKSNTETFASEELCQKEVERQIAAKLKEGFEEVSIPIRNVNVFDLKLVEDARKQKSERLSINVQGSAELLEEVCALDWLKHLELQNVSSISESIGNFKNLDHLEIKESKSLKSIPESLGELKNLTWLSVERTAIEFLPESLGKLSNLKRLNIQHNENIIELPKSIGSLKSLETLWVSYNRENDRSDQKKGRSAIGIPDSIGELTQLTELSLNSNLLSDLPAAIGKLKNLTDLDLNFNKFTEIPKCIFELENLETLEIIYSPLKQIPLEFCNLLNLTRFDIEGNQVENIPEEIVYGGIESIRNFLNPSPAQKQEKVPVADPLELKQSLEQHKGALEKFYRAVKDKAYKEDTKKKLAALQSFLSGETNEIPKAINEDQYYFQDLPSVLTSYRKWTTVDFRILSYVTQGAWSFKKNKDGFFESFYRWMKKEVLGHPEDETLFSDILQTLKEYGVDETKILVERKHEISEMALTSDKKVTSFGKFLLTNLEILLNDFVEAGLPTQFVELFVKEGLEKIRNHIPKITGIKEYDGNDGKKHVPYKTIEILCKASPATIEPILNDHIQNIDCVSCRAELARIRYESFGEKYKTETIDFIKEVLSYISDKKNKNLDRGYSFDWSTGKGFYRDDTPDFIEWLLKTFGKNLQETVFEYVEKTKVLDLNVIGVAVKYLNQDAIDIAGEALDMTIKDDEIAGHFRQIFNILSGLDYTKYYDKTWEIARSEFKKVSETACLALSRLPEEIVIPRAAGLLKEKQAHLREAGVLILNLMRTQKSIQTLEPLLENEKNDDVRNLAVDLIFEKASSLSIAEAKNRILIAKKQGKLDKPLAKWLDETKLPKVLWKDRKALGAEEVRYLFYRQKTRSEVLLDPELRDVVEQIDKSSFEVFSETILKLVQKNGGFKAPNRFAISILGIFGNKNIVPDLENVAKKDTNLNACACLGMMDTMEAARALDRIMQTFKTKYPNVREAAEEGFESIASKMSLTPYELQDRMLPDLGFKNLSKKVNINKIEYTLKISKDLKFTYWNDSNKEVKSPKLNETEKKKNKEESTLFKDSVKQLGINMEYYLVVQRRWFAEDWKDFFLKNPIANAFARNFVWVKVSKNQEKECFYVSESSTLNIEDKKIDIEDPCKILLLHPLCLDEKERSPWSEKIKNLKIDPPLPQLDRETYLLPEEDKNKKISFQFEDKSMSGSTFKYRAEKYGWRRGSVVDGGGISSYRKLFPNENVEVFLKIEGLNVRSFEYSEPMTFKEFFFVNPGSITTGSYVYDEPRSEEDQRLIPFESVNPIVYSETLYDLQRILQTKNEEE